MKPLSDTRLGRRLSRRDWLRTGGVFGLAGMTGIPALLANRGDHSADAPAARNAKHIGPPTGAMHTVGTVDHAANGFDPMEMLTDFDYGEVSTLPDGRVVRDFTIVAQDKEIEIAPGMFFPAWTYNGQVPGPTIRATVGDRIRIRFRNEGSHPHTIHFHGWHPSGMDGSFPDQQVSPGEEFLYEFDAEPVGLHLYHCHTFPLKAHIHKGLYGAFIIDPKTPRPPALELVMTMNGFDTNFDGENEVYAVNSVAFHHMHSPISVKVGETVRIYLLNLTEFDPVNSFHLHASFFDVFRTGTRTESDEFTDTVHFGQGERAILEFKFRWPGRYMFHAHQSEFAELGWMGFFDVMEQV